MSLASKVLQVLKPSFYRNLFNQAVVTTRAELHAGSIRPLFKAMFLIGLTGYTVEYAYVGKYHVAEKQAIIKEALKGHEHH